MNLWQLGTATLREKRWGLNPVHSMGERQSNEQSGRLCQTSLTKTGKISGFESTLQLQRNH